MNSSFKVILIFSSILGVLVDAQMTLLSDAVEGISNCEGSLFMERIIGLSPSLENYWDGTLNLKEWNLTEARISLKLSAPAVVTVDEEVGRIFVSEDSYHISFFKPPEGYKDVNFHVQGKRDKGFPNVLKLTLNDQDICPDPKEWTGVTILGSTNVGIIEGRSTIGADGNCGKRLVNFQGLITNGWPSQEGDWPWHAAIFKRKNRTNYNYACGGSLISSKFVLTAAHCVTEYGHVILEDRFLVKVGLHNLQLAGRNTQELEVYEVIPHENVNISNLRNDIALLKLATQALLTNYVQPVCLWPSTNTGLEEVINKNGIVIGWGLNEEDQLMDILTQGRMPVVSITTCLESNRGFFGKFVSDYVYCAGFRNGTSVCNGDSGGGMVFKKHGTYYLRGIVSLSVSREDRDFCNPKQFVTFTDAAKYLNWIEINMEH